MSYHTHEREVIGDPTLLIHRKCACGKIEYLVSGTCTEWTDAPPEWWRKLGYMKGIEE